MLPLPPTRRPSRRQRRQVLDALAVGYADGQLDEHDHETRVASAMRARTDDDLRATLVDLQLPPGHPAHAVLVPGARTRRTLDRVLVVVGIGFAALVVVALVLSLREDDQKRPESVAMLEQPAVDAMVAQLREQLGTTEVIDAQITDSHVVLHLPADPGTGRYQTWSWDGHELSRTTNGTLGVGPTGLADLRRVDTAQVFANLEKALGMLEAPGEATIQVNVNGGSWPSMLNIDDPEPRRGPPHVEILVRTEGAGDSVVLVTDLTGRKVLRRSGSHFQG